MKFLIKIRYILFLIIINFILSEICIDNWIKNNSNIQKNFFVISATVNNENIKLFFNANEKIRFESENSIIISNQDLTLKYYKELKELYIDEPDRDFNKQILSLVNINKLKKNMKIHSDNVYTFKNKLKFGKIKIYFDKYCEQIDSIFINKNKHLIEINNINIDTIDLENIDSLFFIDSDLDGLKTFDFRYEK